jgi:lipopolysaccharide transport system permease protein
MQPVRIIRPTGGWQLPDLGALWHSRDLLYFLTVRSVRARYAQSVLGVSWAVIQPLFATLVFTVVFGKFAGISSDGVPYLLFSFTAMVPWTFFANIITESSTSLITNAHLIHKVYFPRMVLPWSASLGKLLDFGISILVLGFMLLVFKQRPGLEILWLPLFVLELWLAGLGIGLFLSAMAVQYRDVKHATPFLVQLMMYTAPVVYPASSVPEGWLFWYSLNPMVGVIEGFRAIFLHTQPIPWLLVMPGMAVSALLFIAGSFFFRRMERIFADVA